MNVGNIYLRTKNLIISPAYGWENVLSEGKRKNDVIREFLLPMAILVGLSSLLGTLFFSKIENSFSIGYVIVNGLMSFLIIFLEVYLAGWLITEVATSFSTETNSDHIFNLVVYAQTPFFLALAVTRLFPQLLFLMITGLYTFYLFWLGIIKLLDIPKDKRVVFLLLSGLVMILLFLLLSVIFNSIYEVMLDKFTTFALMP